ncbi:hypothetical protein PHYBLDRAFT_61127 [Phycomyces blakesleeanus NRRL 1555(-)]|uniref:Retrotransposon gag domain-containing protein n=1 Tax=Phycomyces blakesleeanus (strain ATCC 8743b / DSM 1359 / FGSC 10004 / NBRC 33097 / NRRL 1555) TaxID=763407 RepID=A0A167N2Q8_PHYB8|nr:hypothetical protein PHYBLDRAFT_61127 [Phycomyces blakesleeanus NRRL 1555(-)]OAD74824.1 hypothetical protein PHYBLDRAFT_61127 [Phycomyces blakesleeanus NRRL 1555(-)]|eukprot:XP_018292864.1 hypothetical protein PHYBLDRAFT_61127 [Phycomyces blakesleeanus NRRL 1555(-)]
MLPSSYPAPMGERKLYNISKYLSAPEIFFGGPSSESLYWLLHMDRLKKDAGMTNKEAILVVATHFYGMAAKWWAICEAKVTTWEVFSEEFKKQFASRQIEDVRWTEIDKTRQGAGQSIGEVTIHLQELFGLVALANEAQKIQILLETLHPEIAYEVEKSGLSRSWDELVHLALAVLVLALAVLVLASVVLVLVVLVILVVLMGSLVLVFVGLVFVVLVLCLVFVVLVLCLVWLALLVLKLIVVSMFEQEQRFRKRPRASVSFADAHNQPKVSVSEDTAVNMVETAPVYAAKHARVVDPSLSKGLYTHVIFLEKKEKQSADEKYGKAVNKTVLLHTLSNTLPPLQQHLYAQGQLNTFPTNDTYMTLAPDLSPPVSSFPLAPKPHRLRPSPRELPVHISHNTAKGGPIQYTKS